jgi:hypothetical protein
MAIVWTPGGDTPTTIDELAKLVCYVGHLAEYMYRPDEIRISPTEKVKPAIKTSFTNSEGKVVYQFQQTVTVSDDAFFGGTGKIWEFANPIGDLPIPANLKA